MATPLIQETLKLIPLLLENKRLMIDYDKEADILYLNFDRQIQADDSELTDDEVLIRYKDQKVIGFTILNASKRNK